MTFKFFRRGSARCIGLLSAFITILLCLYYISMGQPSIQPKDALQASLLTGQQQQATLISSASGGSGSVLQHQPHYYKNYASHKMKYNGNDDNTASYRQQQQQQPHKLLAEAEYNNDPALQTGIITTGRGLAGDGGGVGDGDGSSTSGSGSITYSSGMYVNNPQWGDKCYILDESDTNITAQEEYAKFDFQPEWIRTKEYWDRGFEERFEAQKKDKQRPPLKMFQTQKHSLQKNKDLKMRR